MKGRTLIEARRTIVHEICHAVTTGSHGYPPWKERMPERNRVGDLDCAAAVGKQQTSEKQDTTSDDQENLIPRMMVFRLAYSRIM